MISTKKNYARHVSAEKYFRDLKLQPWRLSEALGVTIENRHRAQGDALATAEIFPCWFAPIKAIILIPPWSALLKNNILSQPRPVLEALPAVWWYIIFTMKMARSFMWEKRSILKVVFTDIYLCRLSREGKWSPQFCLRYHLRTYRQRINCIITGERRNKRKFPKFNHAKNNGTGNYLRIFRYTDQRGYMHLAIERFNIKKKCWKYFPDYLSARNYLNEKMHSFRLCAKYCHLQTVKKQCYNYDLGICQVPALKKEETGSYNERVDAAIASFNESGHSYVIPAGQKWRRKKRGVCGEKGIIRFRFCATENMNGDATVLRDCH